MHPVTPTRSPACAHTRPRGRLHAPAQAAPQPSGLGSLAERAHHPEELRDAKGALAVDVEYYLAQQVGRFKIPQGFIYINSMYHDHMMI